MNKNAFYAIKKIATQNYKKLLGTFSLVLAENVLFTLYPLIAGWAINKIISGETLLALSYAIIVLLGWVLGATRRKIDTQVFATIYADLCVKVIMSERKKSTDTSKISARVALSRELISFFEEHLPTLFTTAVSIVGSFCMLLVIEPVVGVASFVGILILWLNLRGFIRTNDRLYFRLNNRLEKDVFVIENHDENGTKRHYELTSLFRIAISNKEALGYLIIGIFAFLLFGVAIITLSSQNANAGHIYSVMTYLWTLCISLDDVPRLLQHFSQLKDISSRVSTEISDDL